MASFKDHFPDPDKLAGGVKLPLKNPDGSISDDFVMVRWAETDEVRAALAELKRELAQRLTPLSSEMAPKAKKAAIAKNSQITDEMILRQRCVQVAGWSFDEKTTRANVMAFLKARPDIADRIDQVSANTSLFFTDSGGSS